MEQLITQVGFPIACVIGCAYFIWQKSEQNRADTLRREEKMFEQLKRFGDTLDSFNTTLTKIDSRLEVVEKRIGGLEDE